MNPTIEEILEAEKRVAPYIRNTPLIPFEALSRKLGKEILLKCESLQRVGSFKIRGASNCILQNMSQAKKTGVVTASAGNHAQGVAAISHALGIRATIVMPVNTPPIKVQNTKAMGAEIILHGVVYDEAYEKALSLSQEKGLLYIHPFRDAHVIAGQGTLGLELLNDPQFAGTQAVVVPVGGGGIASGVAIALKARNPQIKIYGVSAENAPTTYESFKAGKTVSMPAHPTLAEGVAFKRTDETMLKLLKANLDDYLLISEEAIARAISVLVEQGKLIVEGAGALSMAAVLEGLIPEKKVCLIISGGNIDVPALTHVLQRGLVAQGRLVHMVVTISDRPGGLHALTGVLAENGTNIIHVYHQRSTLHTKLGETEVELDLETRSEEHTLETLHNLEAKGYRVQRVV